MDKGDMERSRDQHKYLTYNPVDEKWGITVTTIGYQFIPPQGHYPLAHHPTSYSFNPRDGRVLNEYQLVYITKGSGTFAYEGHEITVQAGTMLFLFPGVRHHYCPDPRTGWDEYWVGFKGEYIDAWVRKGFFQVDEPVAHIGLSATIVGLYEEILKFASEEKTGFQILVSGIVTHLLGTVYYKKKNSAFTSYLTDKINEARILMRDHVENPLTPEEIASRLGLGYSWFRRMFKEYTGLSPARYQSRLSLASRTGQRASGKQQPECLRDRFPAQFRERRPIFHLLQEQRGNHTYRFQDDGAALGINVILSYRSLPHEDNMLSSPLVKWSFNESGGEPVFLAMRKAMRVSVRDA